MGHSRHRLLAAVVLVFPLFLNCGKKDLAATTSAVVLEGAAWVPNVTGAGAVNHDANVTLTKTDLATVTGPLVGLAQGWSGREISVTIDMTDDLGDYGSLTLLAQPTGFPAALQGGAYTVLTYLSDGSNDWINLARSGTGGDCFASGAYICDSSGNCTVNSACTISWPSAYADRSHWEQHQIDFSFGSYASTNTFPTCNWSDGTAQSALDPSCAFNSTFFSHGKMRSGGTYTAKYILMTDSYASLSGYNAGLNVSVIKKAKNSIANSGAIDVNVILVGKDVAQATRTEKGKINLDSLFSAVQDFYSASNVNVKLGSIQAYEWTDGEAYANVAMGDFGKMVAAAGSMLPAATAGKAINIFFVKSVSDNSALLGMSGGIGGPAVNGLPNSGVVVSTFGKMDQYNSGCSAAPCGLTQVEYDFADMEQTIAHEMGHYLGLNHPTESHGTEHDLLRDTPICTATDSSGRISIRNCLMRDTNVFPVTQKMCSDACTSYSSIDGNYCPVALECEFNYMMYWSSKYFTVGKGTGDGNLFSAQSGQVINNHPLIQ
ncbi:hypothetical protein WDW37_02120 [Bdellovibrionota bacterium FG-1]